MIRFLMGILYVWILQQVQCLKILFENPNLQTEAMFFYTLQHK